MSSPYRYDLPEPDLNVFADKSHPGTCTSFPPGQPESTAKFDN